MKKRYIVVFSLALVVSFVHVSSVLAEDSTSSGKTPRIEAREEFRDEKRTFMASREAEFKANLQKIRDTRKQTIVSNINDRIANRNTLWISHWNAVTKRLSAILDKIQTRSDEAATKGKDISTITAAIASARTAIATAQTAINAQSGKTYTIDVTVESNLGTSVKNTISTFHSDVKNIIALLNTARKAVGTVFMSLKTIVGAEPSPTSTTQP